LGSKSSFFLAATAIFIGHDRRVKSTSAYLLLLSLFAAHEEKANGKKVSVRRLLLAK
jgi:hypothetical protein